VYSCDGHVLRCECVLPMICSVGMLDWAILSVAQATSIPYCFAYPGSMVFIYRIKFVLVVNKCLSIAKDDAY
jgi:hypothetical protein